MNRRTSSAEPRVCGVFSMIDHHPYGSPAAILSRRIWLTRSCAAWLACGTSALTPYPAARPIRWYTEPGSSCLVTAVSYSGSRTAKSSVKYFQTVS